MIEKKYEAFFEVMNQTVSSMNCWEKGILDFISFFLSFRTLMVVVYLDSNRSQNCHKKED